MRFVTTTTLTLFLLATVVIAGDWHIAGSLRCGDCHLQHSSSGLDPIGGPYSYMLRKNSVNELCLSCHDGTDPTAPDVVEPVQMYSGTASLESAAGFFGLLGLDNTHGHTLGLLSTAPLQGVSHTEELNCASCHAVHGNGNYRNLTEDPAGTGASLTVIDGTDVLTLQKPSDPPTVAGSAAAYGRDNVGYTTSRLSDWCASCHDLLLTNGSSIYPSHFSGHPSNVAMNEFSADTHTDQSHWVGGIGEGFAPQIDGIRRVPFVAPLATTFTAAKTPTGTSQVSCVSCHKAHGSSNEKGMLWPFAEGGSAFVAGCQQCHNK